MSSFWSGFTSKAAGALNKAKEQLKQMTYQQPDQEIENAKQTIQFLQARCLQYKQNYQTLLNQSKNLLNFKIVIGAQNSQELMIEMQSLKSSLQAFKKQAERVSEQSQIYKQSSIHQLQGLLVQKEFLATQLAKSKEKLNQVNESIHSARHTRQGIIESCYKSIQVLALAIGLSVPNIRPENIGLEDLQQFISTQAEYARDANQKLVATLSSKSHMMTGQKIQVQPNLESIREGIIKLIDEAYSKIMQAQDIKITSEELYQKSLKELLESREEAQIAAKTAASQKSHIHNLTSEIQTFQQKAELSTEYKEKLKQAEKLIETLKLNQKKMRDQLQQRQDLLTVKQVQKQSLVEKLSQQIQLVQTLSTQVKEFNTQNSSLREKISQLQSELSNSRKTNNQIKQAELKVQTYSLAVNRLQSVLKSLQIQIQAKTQRIEQLQQLFQKAEFTIQKIRQSKLRHKQQKNYLTVQLQQTIQQQNSSLSNSQLQLAKAKQMKQEAQLLLQKFQKEMNSSQNLIDKRVISTFIVNFLNPNNSEKVRMQMLSNLAAMLDFDQAQKRKVGLIQESTFFSQLASFIANGQQK